MSRTKDFHKIEQIIIYGVYTQTHVIYNLPELGYVTTIWSPDSNYIAVFFNNNQIFILDKNGKELNSIDFSEEKVSIVHAFWPEYGLVIKHNQKFYNVPDYEIEIRKYDNITQSNNFKMIFTTNENSLNLLSVYPEEDAYLLLACPKNNNGDEDCELWVYTEEGKNKSIISFPYILSQIRSAESDHLVAIGVRGEKSTSYSLTVFIFDWKTHTISRTIVLRAHYSYNRKVENQAVHL